MMLNFLGIMGLREEHPGGTELKVLISPLAKELIRLAVLAVGIILIFLTVYLI